MPVWNRILCFKNVRQDKLCDSHSLCSLGELKYKGVALNAKKTVFLLLGNTYELENCLCLYSFVSG